VIAFLHGKLAETAPTHVVVDCGGVGYSVFIPLSSYDKLPPKGGEVQLLTHHHVVAHEGTQQLFGFVTPEEREMFLLLVSISGIGPKLAINILSSTSISTLRGAITSGDTKTLSALRGIGKKTAERLVVELKDKLGAAAPFEAKGRAATPEEQKITDAVLALVSLGYKQMDAHKAVLVAVEKLGPKANVEGLVRTALRSG
jgi:holliday junction DNA helicase RuvA